MGASLGVFLVACGDDDNTVTPPPSGNDAGGNESDSGNQEQDSGQQGDASPKPDPARIQFVNAATDFGPNNESGGLRICFALSNDGAMYTVAGLPALPEESPNPAIPPGAYIGTGGAVSGTGTDIAGFHIQPYIMNAGRLFARGVVKPGPGTPSTACDKLLAENFDGGVISGNGPLVENVDYWKLPPIPAQTFLPEKSYILVLTGCSQDSTAPAAKCGEGADAIDGGAGIGNLRVHIIEVDRATAIDADKIGAQFIHASAPGKAFLDGQAVGVLPAFVRAGDAGATNVATAEVPLYGHTDLVQVADITPATDSFSANAAVPTLSIPLTTVQAATYPGGAPPEGTIRQGAAFTFIAVGDPTEPPTGPAGPNPKVFHYLAFPNDPPLTTYKP